MKAAQSGGPDYQGRIRRAKYLASAHPFAAEVLVFYEKIAAFQGELYSLILRESRNKPAADERLRGEPNAGLLLPHFPKMLALAEQNGPEPVREAARQLRGGGSGKWEAALREFWRRRGRSPNDQGSDDEPGDERLSEFLLRAFLQPYTEFLGTQMAEPPLATNYRDCPRCGAAALLGVLRPEGDGAKRRLMCSFCLQEWDFRRIFCAACGETAEQKLPVYVTEDFPHIRMETCESCKSYLRTIDLTKDGNAVPLVDDLAAIPLSLWAEEHGYQRIQENLLGT